MPLLLFLVLRPQQAAFFPYPTLFRSDHGSVGNRALGIDDRAPDAAAPADPHVRQDDGVLDDRGGAEDSVILTNRSEEHTSELQSLTYVVCRLLLEQQKRFPGLPPLLA